MVIMGAKCSAIIILAQHNGDVSPQRTEWYYLYAAHCGQGNKSSGSIKRKTILGYFGIHVYSWYIRSLSKIMFRKII
jgi:hypothetical protein